MIIDLTSLLNNFNESINIDKEFNIDSSMLVNTNIINLNDVRFIGNITKAIDQFNICGILSGTMVLPDDLSLKPIKFPFNVKIDEYFNELEEENENNLKIINNSLDIISFLWQNILLEVPSKIRDPKDINVKLEGDNWRLIDETELANTNNALSDLQNLLDKRKE